MQINGTNSLNAMQYAQMQNTQTNTVKSESSQNTLQNDKVTFSAEALGMTPELNRGGGAVITKREED
ncbi:hypothetical protein [Pseudoalteromonas spongiae]|uniref:hypothetical protein n=1 Tax=Pseudoalteromonas spongiae TaxID=298657 RepID=UPI00026CB3C1|nr:hypothetical protein [Pseudoalteromonas spongiae]ATC97909.1 hypothetical protein PSPO_a0724 [Pseudoalteromonas spongiae UST010723-006]